MKIFFKRSYLFRFMVQFDSKTGKHCVCGDQVKWLVEVLIKNVYFYKRAEKEAWRQIEAKHPEYKEFIQLESYAVGLK